MSTTHAERAEPAGVETVTQLTGFQRDILTILGVDGPQKGVAVLDALERIGYDEVNHGRLYPNLDVLVESGWVSKATRDKRTNEYALTQRAHVALAEYATLVDDSVRVNR